MAKQTDNSQSTIENSQFFEIVNWKKAQSRMKGGGQDWLKLYTSLLEHDGFAGMDDSARMLIIALWLYAARSGLHILPADPAWLKRKIPILNGTPDLEPLLSATDVYGHPTPFISYCKPPKARGDGKGGSGGSAATGATGDGKGKGKSAKTKGEKKQGEKNRVEERREEKREETKPLRVSGEKNKERKERISPHQQTQQKKEQQTETEEPEKPENPNDSEAGAAGTHIVPTPPQSAYRGPQAIGAIIGQRFADHWQDPDAEAFGWQIVEALGLPADRNNLTARSEWGSFAKWWSDIKKMCPAIALDGLRSKAIRKAEFLNSPKARSARNKSAVWFHIMEGETGHGSGQQARASP